MVQFSKVQGAHTYGVLDPYMSERRDTKFLGASLSAGDNIITLPQGGYTYNGGTTQHGPASKALFKVDLTNANFLTVNGGTGADLLSGNPLTTTTPAAGSRFVLADIQFTGALPIHAIDVDSVYAETTGGAGALIAEVFLGGQWVQFGEPLLLTTSPRSRRFVSGPPGSAGVTANQFRVSVDGTVAVGTITYAIIRAHGSNGTVTTAKLKRYKRKANDKYHLMVSAGSVDIFRKGQFLASVRLPLTEEEVAEAKIEARFDSVLFLHNSMRPRRLFRLGDDAEWSMDKIEFENIPLVDLGGTYTNGVTEKQEIQLYGFAINDNFEFTFEGETTAAITLDAIAATTTADIVAALEGLSNIEPGITVTITGINIWSIEFTGAGNEFQDKLQIAATALNNDGFIRVRTLTKGKEPGEPVFSNAQGWPGAARFAQQRVLYSKIPARPNSVLASVQGDPFNLNTETEIATGAFMYEVGTGSGDEIREVYIGTVPVFFADNAVIFNKNRNLSATEVPDFGESEAPPIDPNIPPIPVNAGIYYIQDNGSVLRYIKYTALEEAYTGENASILSAFLIRQPTSFARRRAINGFGSDLFLMANEDGTMTSFTVMTTQDVSGFSNWWTRGKYKFVEADSDNVFWMLVERIVNGVTQLRFEEHNPAGLLDEATMFTMDEATKEVVGLDYFNGVEVWLTDGENVQGPYRVTAGKITCRDYMPTGTVGTWSPLATEDQDVNLIEETGQRMARLKRCYRSRVSVLETTSLAMSVNGGPAFDLKMYDNNEITFGDGKLSNPYTGWLEAEGMHGFTTHGRLQLTQLFPGSATVRAVEKNMVA